MSDNTIQARWYFAIPIYDKLIPEFQLRRELLIDTFLKMRESDTGIVRSNLGGWHSDDDLHRNADENIQWLLRSILTIASVCINDFEKDREHGDIVMTSAWVNVNDTHNWNAPHMHLPADWSGVFYVSVDETSHDPNLTVQPGDIMFFNPMPFGARHKRPTTVNYTPKNGLLLLFPSYLLHMVSPHISTEPRISISFNIRVPLTPDEIRAVRQQN